MTDAKKMALLACEALEDKKASDIKVIDIEQITTLADYCIIEEPYKHYFTEKVSYSRFMPLQPWNGVHFADIQAILLQNQW